MTRSSTAIGPVNELPDVLDMLVVGGGPSGTAAAFRARELGLAVLVVDFDDVLKRIRDYPKDKQILPDFGGGDRMAFPDGGDCVRALHFQPIDKDDMHLQWRGMYRDFGVPVITSIELTGAERAGNVWNVLTWDHKKGEARTFRAKHVVLAIGRGVPRRLDLSGNADGIAYRMDDPAKYVDEPVLVLGGGTSAAEAVLAISEAKIAGGNECAVYWSFRGTKMPRVSKALAERFFEAYIGNGNIRSCPDSEPVAVVMTPERQEVVSLKIDRKTPSGRPAETAHLEFAKSRVIACIGEDIPEKLLLTLGIHMVPVGAPGDTGTRKMMAVTSLLETEQPNIYLIGDLLSQAYLEVDDFKAPVDAHRQVKHRGNIKSSLRDGVFVAEVIRQRVDGKAKVDVQIRDAAPAGGALPKRGSAAAGVQVVVAEASAEPVVDPTALDDSAASLVLVTPTGIDAGEFRLKPEGTTTLGKVGTDIAFAQDTFLSDAHASITSKDGVYQLRDDGSRSGTYLKVRSDKPVRIQRGDLLRAGRQILVVAVGANSEPVLEHYDATGAEVGSYALKDTVVLGRSGGTSNPDVILDDSDSTLSRFQLSVMVEPDGLYAQDFGSKNGSWLKVDAQRVLEHGDTIRIGAQLLRVELQQDLPEKQGSAPVPVTQVIAVPTVVPPAPAPVPAAARAAATGPTGPHVTFNKQNKSGPLDPNKSILAWADENEVTIDYECWIGMCGCDAIRVISGAEHLNPVTEKEIKTLKRKGLEPGPCRLACMCKASGPVVVEVV